MIARGTVAGEFVSHAYRTDEVTEAAAGDDHVGGSGGAPAMRFSPRQRAEAGRVLGLALADRGVDLGVRVALVSRGWPGSAWTTAELAVLAAGGVSVPLDLAWGRPAVARLVGELDIGLVIAVAADRDEVGLHLAPGVSTVALPVEAGDRHGLYDEGRAIDAEHPDRFETMLARLTPVHTATLVAEAGRGLIAEVSHAEVLDAVRGFTRLLATATPEGGGHRLITTLLPTDLTGRIVGHYWPALSGGSATWIDGAGSRSAISATAACQPTVGVVDAAFVDALTGSVVDGPSTPLRRWQAGLGRLAAAGERLGPGERFELALLDRAVAAPRRARLGLRACRALFVVGDVRPSALRELAAIGVAVQRAYHHPALGLVAAVPPGSCEPHSFGPPLPGTAIRLGARSTIEVQRRSVWRSTGERGAFDARGWLRADIGVGA